MNKQLEFDLEEVRSGLQHAGFDTQKLGRLIVGCRMAVHNVLDEILACTSEKKGVEKKKDGNDK